MEAHWLIPIVAFTVVPITVFLLAIIALAISEYIG